jgi:transcriptional regulator with XRE-family HTH domain
MAAVEIGARIRLTRKRLGLGRRRVAANAGLSPRRLAKFERGRVPMSVDDVRSVAGSLGVDVSELVGEDSDDAPSRAGRSALNGPSPSEIRIDHLFDTAPFADLADPPPRPERRRIPRARTALEQSFAEVWSRLEDVVRAAERLAEAGAGDDVGALVAALERELDDLRADPDFELAVARHDEARAVFESAAAAARDASWQSRGVANPDPPS